MTKINDSSSAFPEPLHAQCGGMSLRDYFAAQALSGLLACNDNAHGLASLCYKIADAMIAQRDKEQ
jgi:hypothetical protein